MKPKVYKPARIPMAVALAIATYYHNRSRQYKTEFVNTGTTTLRILVPVPERKWNKEADEQAVFDTARKFGFHSGQSCCGTFWLFRGKHCYEIGESTWPQAKLSRNT